MSNNFRINNGPRPFKISNTGNSPFRYTPPIIAPPAGGSFFANQPVGWTQIDDYDWSDDIPSPSGDVTDDWSSVFVGQGGASGTGNVELVTNEDGPHSPSTAVMFTWPAGDYNGDGVGTLFRGIGSVDQLYYAVIVKWDDNFENNGTSTKFLHVTGGDNILLQFNRFTNFMETLDGSTPLGSIVTKPTLGVWHEFEWILDAVNSTFALYMNGVLQYSGDRSFSGNWTEIALDSTLGGGSMTKDRVSFRWTDHTRIAVGP